ncbi:MAG: double-strand break repair protein AddB [Rhodospirillaceae bacterium]|nr:double-strand break repair protein AddB [Rhodospirillaceae bacterium]
MTNSRVFNIPAGEPFLERLAEGLWEQAGRDPLTLTRATVMVPTRRAMRGLREAFLRLGDGRAMLLPSIRPIGDVDDGDEALVAGLAGAAELPPAISSIRRQMMLTQMVLRFARTRDRAAGLPPVTTDQAALLAAELARLVDQVHTEGLDFSGLKQLVPDQYATHWQDILGFLAIVTEYWPDVLGREGAIDPADWRARATEGLAELWRRLPPSDPIIIAGSTGSIPSTAALMDVVRMLPKGAVVLPGLDRAASDRVWASIQTDASHPQHGLALLLHHFDISRPDVLAWLTQASSVDGDGPRAARRRLLDAALLPADATGDWRRLQRDHAADDRPLDGVSMLLCPSQQEEAVSIALMLREALETGGRTAALITPDRTLARRVKSELRRWDIEVDDSAGEPLANTETMALWRLTAAMALHAVAPVPLLAVLKQPLAAGGLAAPDFRRRARALERAVLRGPRPGPGISGLLEALHGSDADADLIEWAERFGAEMGPLVDAMSNKAISLADLLQAHDRAVTWLASSEDEAGEVRLWRGDAGEEAAAFIADLYEATKDADPIDGRAYPALVDALLQGRAWRPRYGHHPRLAILGPLEARLQHFDLTVLGGLNEGTWPPDLGADPWMSRGMRRSFGLPEAERRIGLSAHDFAMACMAPNVVLTRSRRVDGSPTVPSRWLLRLETVIMAAGHSDAWLDAVGGPWLLWQKELDRPGVPDPVSPPAPRPPVSARPRQLSATRIETWIRDPYALYASRILSLKALDPIDADPGAADRGNFIHKALDDLVSDYPSGDLPGDALDRLLEYGRSAFGVTMAHPTVWAFWWPRFERIAHWFIEHENQRRRSIGRIATECMGEMTLQGPAGAFKLTAKADRIERSGDGRYAVIDYKTGGAPSRKQLQAGLAPQLPLEALILAAGGFPGLPAGELDTLAYWRLTGGNPAGLVIETTEGLDALIESARTGLEDLIATFDDPDTPYLAQPDAGRALDYNDYAHLARVREWATREEG